VSASLDIRQVPTGELVGMGAPYNPRRISDADLSALRRSLETWGCVEPVVANRRSGHVVGGHQRIRAAEAAGIADLPVVWVDLDDVSERALNIALNKISGEWDESKLATVLAELEATGADVSLTGFSDDEIKDLLASIAEVGTGLTDPDAVPDPPDEPKTQRGDLIVLGHHRLMCGDSAKSEDVARLLDGARIQLVNTDPPYNVKVEPRSNNAIAAGLSSFTQTHHQKLDLERHPEKAQPTTTKMRAKDRPLENDFVTDEAFVAMLGAWFQNMADALEPGRAFYAWGGYSNIKNYPLAIENAGLYFSQAIIWDKEWPVLTRKDFMGAHEWCFYGWKAGAAHWFNPEINNATDLWHVKKIAPPSMVHLTEKPVELAELAMTYSSRHGEHVLDLFGGSGSTMIAAERMGRRAFLVEIDPAYCDVICTRWQEFTGRKATGWRGNE
jgi:DNA modification methylase